jgi:hypothetical protein
MVILPFKPIKLKTPQGASRPFPRDDVRRFRSRRILRNTGASKLRNDDEPRRVISVRMMEIARAEYAAIPAGAPSRRAAEVATTAAKNRRPEGLRPHPA